MYDRTRIVRRRQQPVYPRAAKSGRNIALSCGCWMRALQPEEVNLLIGRDEDTALPDLIGEGAVALH